MTLKNAMQTNRGPTRGSSVGSPMRGYSGVSMKYLVLILCLVSSKAIAAFDHSVAVGQWAAYQKNLLSADYYYFLNINPDFSGILVRNYGNKAQARAFEPDDLRKHDGFFEIMLSPNERAVFSAWKLKSGSGALTGQIFMYNADGTLFNMLYFPLDYLNADHELLKHEAIKDLSTTHR